MNNIELLSPAGSIDTMYAGINAGADAVYIGGQLFGARAYADNPNHTQLIDAMDYIHFNQKKIYLTVNTLLKDKEIEEKLFEYLLPLYEAGLDAVIVQDLGVFQFIKTHFPKMDIHASTQMGICGVYSAELLKEMGASRIVTARELSLQELKKIHDTVDIEIESFIHGAMCYSYSGMCLFSSIAGGRSGNRGRCAGPCRQPYEVYENHKRLNHKNQLYALSLKDMNTLPILPEIIQSGVYSLKIEGRMKSPEYAAGVVSVYRKYIDLYFEKGIENYQISQTDIENLSGLYSRSGSTTGYYKSHNGKSMISFEKPAYKTENSNFTDRIRKQYCQGRNQKKVTARICLKKHKPAVLELWDKDRTCTVTGNIVDEAANKPLSEENIRKQLDKTGDSLLKFHKIFIDMDDNIFMPVKHLNELRRSAIQKYTEGYLADCRRLFTTEDMQEEFVCTESRQTNENKMNLICSVSTPQQAECALKYPQIKEIYVSTDYIGIAECSALIKCILNAGKKCYVSMPAIFREKGIQYMDNLMNSISDDSSVGLIVRNIDELGYVIEHQIKDYIVDNPLYAFNKYSYSFYKAHYAKRVTLSYELNYQELIRQSNTDNELILYGKIPLMITSGCVHMNYHTCDKIQKEIDLKDRLGYHFIVRNCCNFCYNIIYNNIPLSLLGVKHKLSEIKTKNYRLNFTTEDAKTTGNILDKFVHAFYHTDNHYDIIEDYDYTRGHFNRGVE